MDEEQPVTQPQIDDQAQKAQFSVSLIPYHTHNGTDSPQIDPSNLLGWKIITSTPTFDGYQGQEVLVDTGATKLACYYINGSWECMTLSTSAIIFNSKFAAAFSGGGTTTINSFTVSGTNPVIFVALGMVSGDAPTSVKWDSVALTLVGSTSSSGAGWVTYLYYLRGPNPGNKSLQIVSTGSHTDEVIIASYNNANQSSQVDVTGNTGPTTTTHYTQSLTTLTDNSLVIMAGTADSKNILTPDNGTNIRAVTDQLYLADSSTVKHPPGSVTLGLNSASQAFTGIMATILPD